MTLINYLTRIHFADGVLEEALRSEIEAFGKSRPLLIADEQESDRLFGERILTVISSATQVVCSPSLSIPTENTARAIADTYRAHSCDLVVAFGSNRAIDVAKTARIAIAHEEPLAALSNDEGGSNRISGLPVFIAIPGISGFPAALTDYVRVRLPSGRVTLIAAPQLMPSITICDPSVTLEASDEDKAVAIAGALARSVDVCLSPAYNPTADGLAYDALARVAENIGKTWLARDLEVRREMMAADLNSTLAMQKGLCVVHALSNAMSAAVAGASDPHQFDGALLSPLVRHYGKAAEAKAGRIKGSLRLEPSQPLAWGLATVLADLATPNPLAGRTVTPEHLASAARQAVCDRAIGNGPRNVDQQDILLVLEAALGTQNPGQWTHVEGMAVN